MEPKYIVVDGEMGGTGLREKYRPLDLEPGDLGISDGLQSRIREWLLEYERAYHSNFTNEVENMNLDAKGVEIAKCVKQELPSAEVSYYSSVTLCELPLE